MANEMNLAAQLGSEQIEAAQGMLDIPGVAANVEVIAKQVMAFEPMVAGIVSMFFPPAAAAQPFIVMAMPFVIRALDDIAQSNGGDMIKAFLELAQHLSKGNTNSSVLSPPIDGLDNASQQGSG